MQPILRRRELRPADVGRAVNHLPLQVAEVDDVEIDDADAADAGRGEIQRRRRAEAARADAEHAARLQLPLPFHADLRHDQMPAVALDFVVGAELIGLQSDLTTVSSLRIGAARHRRNDADRVARLHRRLLFLQIADVLVVQIDVDEAPQLALLVVEVLASARRTASSGWRAARRWSCRRPRRHPACR